MVAKIKRSGRGRYNTWSIKEFSVQEFFSICSHDGEPLTTPLKSGCYAYTEPYSKLLTKIHKFNCGTH